MSATPATGSACSGCNRLREIYDRHRNKRAIGDVDWTFLAEHVTHHATAAVKATKYKIPLAVQADVIQELDTLLLAKMLRCKFETPKNFEGFLWLMAKRDLITVLRKIKSVAAASESSSAGDDDPAPLDRSAAACNGSPEMLDAFGAIRDRLPAARFPLYSHLREVMLAVLLDTQRYPSPKFACHVPRDIRIDVYNSCIVDVNRAMEALSAKA